MASILLLTADVTAGVATTLEGSLVGLGHTVTLSQAVTAADLDTAWGAGFDVLAVQEYSTATSESTSWVTAKWTAGVPVLLGSGEDGVKTALGINSEPSEVRELDSLHDLTLTNAHAITDGLVSPVTYRTGTDTLGSFQWAGTLHGVTLGQVDRIGAIVPAMTVVDRGAGIEGGTAPARAVWLGWARTADGTFTADGETMIGRSVDWLAASPGDVAASPDDHFAISVTGSDSEPVGSLLVDRAPVAAPPTITERPIMRHSHQPTVADFTVSPDGSVHAKGLWAVVEEVVGVPHIWVDGIDVTYLRGVPVILDDIAASEPFGWESATLTLPQVPVWEEGGEAAVYPATDLYPGLDLYPGTGDLEWLRPDAQVEAHIIAPDGSKVAELFSGHLTNDGAQVTSSATATVWECEGDLVAAFYYLHREPITLDPTDIGTLIPKVLNGVPSRRWGTISTVTTGITTLSRGSGDDYVGEYAAELLADAWTDSGDQWTIARTSATRGYEMRLKDRETVHWTAVPGTPGIDMRLDADHASRSDAVMGRGINPSGYAWSGREWPNMVDYDPPDFPNADGSNVITVGESDADTDSGDGISVWEQRAADLGFDIEVDGLFSPSDSQVVRDIQARMGAQVDGILGPQTWNATWEVGIVDDALASIRLPLAWRPEVEPNLYGPNGAILGDNPAYDASIIRRERPIDFGPQTRKRDGVRSSRREVERTQHPGWFGEMTFKADPQEGSRFLMREGDNILVPGWRGSDLLLHIAKPVLRLSEGSVKVTVDTKARDAMTLASIRRRDRDAQIDPARRPGNVNRKSRQSQDVRTEFEGDSPAGRLYRRTLFGGLWSVFRLPLSEAGKVNQVVMNAEGGATFALGLFASPVQPADLLSLVGNPTLDSDAWKNAMGALERDFGLIEAWGAGDTLAGPSLDDTGGFSYWSNHGGWVWVAAYSSSSTHLTGRFYPAPIDS